MRREGRGQKGSHKVLCALFATTDGTLNAAAAVAVAAAAASAPFCVLLLQFLGTRKVIEPFL